MVTATDVHDKSGRLLLKAQTPITENRLTVLKTWGIQQVQIQSEGDSAPGDTPTPAPLSSSTRRKAQEMLQRRFELAGKSHEALSVLYDFCLDYCAQQLERQQRRSS